MLGHREEPLNEDVKMGGTQEAADRPIAMNTPIALTVGPVKIPPDVRDVFRSIIEARQKQREITSTGGSAEVANFITY